MIQKHSTARDYLFDPDDTYDAAVRTDEILQFIAHRAAFKTLGIMRVALWVATVIAAMLTPLHDGWLTFSVVFFVIGLASQGVYEAQLSAMSVHDAANEIMQRSMRPYSYRAIIVRSLIDAVGSTILGLTIRATMQDWTMTDIIVWGMCWFILTFSFTIALRFHRVRRDT